MKVTDVGDGFTVAFVSVLSFYLIGMACMAIRGFLMKKKEGLKVEEEGREVERLSGHKMSEGRKMEAEMNYHFLAGANFGGVVIFLNMCAQYIGGIVMVAAPDDTRALGLIMLCWISGCSMAGGTFNVFAPRLREIMSARTYLSPNDYLTDRYRSVWVTVMGVVCSTFHMIMFTGLEWKSLANVLAAMLGDQPEDENVKGWVWACGLFIFCCECLGGMSSVALTDAVQAALLLFAFFMLPVLCSYHFGGYDGVGGMDCQNREVAAVFGMIGPVGLTEFHNIPTAGLGSASPFNAFHTEACYTNRAADVPAGCALALPIPNQGQEVSNKVNAPFALLGMGPQPSAHNFGSYRQGGQEVDEYCCWNWNADTGVCDDIPGSGSMVGVCPEIGSVFTPFFNRTFTSTGDDFTAGGYYRATGAHHVLGFDQQSQKYVANLVSNATVAACNSRTSSGSGAESIECFDYDYAGKVTLRDGTDAYTNVSVAVSQMGCTGINLNSFWHMKYPFKELCALMFGFSLGWIPFALAPITLHRVMTAKSADSFRSGLSVLHLFPLTFFTPMVLLGMTAAALWPEDTTSAMPLVTFHIAKLSGFGSVVAVLALTGCIASFMSTADSMVICGSLLFTVDVWWHVIRREKTSVAEMMIVTKFVSLAMICCGISIALETKLNFIEMLNIGNGILGSLVPVYLGQFFPKLRSFEVAVGMVINIIVVITMELQRLFPLEKYQPCGTCEDKTQPRGANPHGGTSREAPGLPPPFGQGDADELYLWFLPGVWGLAIAVPITMVLGHVLHYMKWDAPQRIFDKLQGFPVEMVEAFDPAVGVPDSMSPKEIAQIPGQGRLDLDREGAITLKLVDAMYEPIRHYEAWPFLAFPYLVLIALPWWGGPYPDVMESQKAQGGMPEWAFDFMFVNSTGTACLVIVALFFWKGRPDEAEQKVKRERLRRQSVSTLDRNHVSLSKVAPAEDEPGKGNTHAPLSPSPAVDSSDDEVQPAKAQPLMTIDTGAAGVPEGAEPRGVCRICGNTVWTHQERVKEADGNYVLRACLDKEQAAAAAAQAADSDDEEVEV